MYIYYVYAYISKSGRPYYIGKGTGRRAYVKHPGITLPSDQSKIVILENNLSNVGALALERRYIRWYGRKDNNTGILLNKTDGGDCPPSRKNAVISEETRKKQSNAKIGYIPWNKGVTGYNLKPMSEEKLIICSIKSSERAKITVRCPHCGKEGQKIVMHKHHFDKCKYITATTLS
jgi:hypothetical protein